MGSFGALALFGWLALGPGCSRGGAPAEGNGPVAGAEGEDVAAPALVLTADSGGRLTLGLRAVRDRAPRMAEVHLGWSPGWRLTGWEAGAAARQAGKDVVVQEEIGGARVLVFASGNAERLSDGVLAELRLEREEGASPDGTAEILARAPMLAPGEAEQGLRLGPPVALR